MMADNIEHVISYWVVFEEFESPALGGYAVVSHWAPYLLGGVFFGALADRYDCRKLFLIAMAIFMGVSFGWAYVFWTETTQTWHVVALLTAHGLGGALYTPASQVVIHDIVGRDHLASAVRMTATTRMVGLLFGPAIGGGLLLVLGPALGLAVNALIYLPMVSWALREKYTGHGDLPASERQTRPLSWGIGPVLDTIRESRGNRTLLAMIVLGGLTSLLVGNAHHAQMPEFAKEFIGESEGVVYTVLLLASAVGAIFGGLVLETLPSLTPSRGKAIAMAGCWTLCILAFAAAPSYPLALAALFVSGIFQIGYSSMAQSLVQLEAPAERRGRIVGLYNMSVNGLRTGSGFTVGFLGAAIGIHLSLALSATVLLAALAILALYVRGRPVVETASVQAQSREAEREEALVGRDGPAR
jgi:MFS family permease